MATTTWLDLVENPKAITSLFDKIPTLKGIEIFSIKIDRDGPRIDLLLDLKDYRSNPPLRWRTEEANAVTMELQLIGIESLEIQGWSTTVMVDITMERLNESTLALTGTGDQFRIRTTFSWARIAHVTPGQEWPPDNT